MLSSITTQNQTIRAEIAQNGDQTKLLKSSLKTEIFNLEADLSWLESKLAQANLENKKLETLNKVQSQYVSNQNKKIDSISLDIANLDKLIHEEKLKTSGLVSRLHAEELRAVDLI